MNLVEEIAFLFRGSVRRLGRQLSEETGRTLNQIRALRAIALEDIRTQTALAERLQIDAAATSRVVDRLVKDGLIRRCQGDDRRSIRLTLTRKAAPELAAIEAAEDRMGAELRGYLSGRDVAALERILESLNAALAKAHHIPRVRCTRELVD